MSEIPNPREIERYLAMSEADLYELLVPQEARRQLYSREGLIARGQEIFASAFQKVRSTICGQYTKSRDATKNLVDLTILIAATLSSRLGDSSVPVLPMAALIAKIGLERLCPPKS